MCIDQAIAEICFIFTFFRFTLFLIGKVLLN